MDVKSVIENGKTALGIELGSTRIKGVLVDFQGKVLAVGRLYALYGSLYNSSCR